MKKSYSVKYDGEGYQFNLPSLCPMNMRDHHMIQNGFAFGYELTKEELSKYPTYFIKEKSSELLDNHMYMSSNEVIPVIRYGNKVELMYVFRNFRILDKNIFISSKSSMSMKSNKIYLSKEEFDDAVKSAGERKKKAKENKVNNGLMNMMTPIMRVQGIIKPKYDSIHIGDEIYGRMEIIDIDGNGDSTAFVDLVVNGKTIDSLRMSEFLKIMTKCLVLKQS